jgi:DNA-binding MarR family transcriptional regulator
MQTRDLTAEPVQPDGLDTPDSPRRAATHELSTNLRIAVARLSRRLRAEKADDELSDGQTSVLFLLVREGPHTLGALSEHERVTPPSMNRTVNGLVAAGYASRAGDPEDGRRVSISATDAGRDLIVETRRRRDAWLFRRLDDLSAQERTLLDQAAVLLRGIADS